MEEEPTGSDLPKDKGLMDSSEEDIKELELEIEKLHHEYIITCLKLKYLYDVRDNLQSIAEDIMMEETEEIEDTIEMEESEEDESDDLKTDSDFSVADERDSSGSEQEEETSYRRPTTRQSSSYSHTKRETKGMMTRSKARTSENENKKSKKEKNQPLMESAMLLCSLKKSSSQSSKDLPAQSYTPPTSQTTNSGIPVIPSATPLIENNPTIGQLPPSLLESVNKQRPKGTYQDLSHMIPPILPLSGNDATNRIKKEISEPSLSQTPQVSQTMQTMQNLQTPQVSQVSQVSQTPQIPQTPQTPQIPQSTPRPTVSTPNSLIKPTAEASQLRSKPPPIGSPGSSGSRSMFNNIVYNTGGTPLNHPIYPHLNQNQMRTQAPTPIYGMKQTQAPVKRPQPYNDINRVYNGYVPPGYEFPYPQMQQGMNPIVNSPYIGSGSGPGSSGQLPRPVPNVPNVPNRTVPMINSLYPQQPYPVDMMSQMQYPQNMYTPVPYSMMPNGTDKLGTKVDGMGVRSMPTGAQQMSAMQPFIPTIATDKNGNILPTS